MMLQLNDLLPRDSLDQIPLRTDFGREFSDAALAALAIARSWTFLVPDGAGGLGRRCSVRFGPLGPP